MRLGMTTSLSSFLSLYILNCTKYVQIFAKISGMCTPNQKISDYMETWISRSRWVTILGIFPGRSISQEVRVRFIPLYATYTGCPRRNLPEFGRVFLMLNYTDITQNTYIRSWTVTEIMAREKCGLLAGSTYCTWPAVPSALPDTRNQYRVCVAGSAMRLEDTLLLLRQ